MTVEQNIAFPLVEGERMAVEKAMPEVMKVSKALKVDDLLPSLPDAISNGQRKRVALARALVSKPDIVIYDEPTTGQDPVMMQNVDDMILAANQSFDITSIVISHDMHSTFRIADHIIMIKDGHLVIAGSPDEVRNSSDPRVQAFVNAGNKA
jgi:ABC-type transporter Mla maintaining outer membrane lipid asymmetry ATPase subunit MlaF